MTSESVPWDARGVVLALAEVRFRTENRSAADWQSLVLEALGDAELFREPLELQEERAGGLVLGLDIHFHFPPTRPSKIEWILAFSQTPARVSPRAQRTTARLRGIEGAIEHLAAFVGEPSVHAELECSYLVNERKLRSKIPRPKKLTAGRLVLQPDSVEYSVRGARGRKHAVQAVSLSFEHGDPAPYLTASGAGAIGLDRELLGRVDDMLWEDVAILLARKR